jgi:hypothetical protein
MENKMAEINTRQIIDYAQDQNGVEFRNALYSAIHDKVSAHIDAKKQEIAQTLINNPEPEETQVQDTEIENA